MNGDGGPPLARATRDDGSDAQSNDGPDTRAVQPEESLDLGLLTAYLLDHASALDLSDADRGPVHVEQFGGGHSNLTYAIRIGAKEFVLRRPPRGPLPPAAHDVVREARWLAALHPLYRLAPRPSLVCDDTSVLGAPFYLMERRHGIVVRHTEPATLAGLPAARRRVSAALVDALADLHAIDVTASRIGSLGKPAGFLERQVRGWRQRWEAAQTDSLPEMDAVGTWLSAHLPPDPPRASVLHGDYKLDNAMLDAAEPSRLVAVFDWEMCALGDPLVDLGIMLAYWRGDIVHDAHDSLAVVTHLPGWFSREELVDRYAARHPVDPPRLAYCETFALFKVAVVIQQIVARFVRGHTRDPRFGALAPRVSGFARAAADASQA